MHTKPTPTAGPWIVDDKHIHCAKGLTLPHGQEPETDVICEVNTDCHADGLLTDTDKANLRLVAAAPDLLAALKSAVAQIEMSIDLETWTPDTQGKLEAYKLCAAQGRAAIAKAEGAQP